ncbi:TPA_asm: hypothetical protein GacPV1_gp08 [Geoglobus acetivorans pleomorphic virus 1]|uniref:Uncharacterized protein n=2 Tax=root TaxID=1 RepID=A0A0A7GEJ4_GEOAI|nr:hypothetical protein GACE_1430 [Geoglobus acetivorans]
MTDFLSASPLLILAALGVVSWLTESRAVKLITLLFFFGYPLMQGKTAMPGLDLNQVLDFILGTANYWLSEALNALIEYVRQKISPL